MRLAIMKNYLVGNSPFDGGWRLAPEDVGPCQLGLFFWRSSEIGSLG